MHEQNETFNKEIETIKKEKKKPEISELKTERKSSIENLKSRISHVKEIISTLKDRSFEMSQLEEQYSVSACNGWTPKAQCNGIMTRGRSEVVRS